MALARYESFALDNAGNVLASPSVQVNLESSGALASLFSDRAGASGISNPFTGGSDGLIAFHVIGGAYKITIIQGATTRTLRYVAIGTAGETDTVVTTPTVPVGVVAPGGRLTLTTGVPITTSDVSGATTLYYSPLLHRLIPIYDGANFNGTDIGAELSQLTTDTTKSPAAVAASKIYDVFVWSDSGVIRATRGPAWASDTSRGTGAGTSEIQQVSGIWTNKNAITNGPAANRGTLVGSVRSNASSQLVDSQAFRWVSNIYNAVPRPMQVLEATSTWTYTTATFRQARASAANQLDMLQSLAGCPLRAEVIASYSNSSSGQFGVVGIDIDTITPTTLTNSNLGSTQGDSVGGVIQMPIAKYIGFPGMGRHIAIWKEYSTATGTGTWNGSTGIIQSGIMGEIFN